MVVYLVMMKYPLELCSKLQEGLLLRGWLQPTYVPATIALIPLHYLTQAAISLQL